MQDRQVLGDEDGLAVGAGIRARVPGVVKCILDLEIERRRAGGDAVEILGMALRLHESLAPAVGAADEIGATRPLAVEGRHDRLGDDRRRMHAAMGEVDPQLRVGAEIRRGAFVTHIGRRDRHLDLLERLAAMDLMDLVRDAAAQAAAAGLQVTPIPAIEGQPETKFDLRLDDPSDLADGASEKRALLRREDTRRLVGRAREVDIGEARAGALRLSAHGRRPSQKRRGQRGERQIGAHQAISHAPGELRTSN